MPKHIDNVPKLTEFRPPWITEDGTEVEIDKDKLKKYIHNLVTDKAKAQDSRDEAVESSKAVEAERDELKSTVDSKDPDSASKIAKLEKKLEDAEAKTASEATRADRAEVAAEKGLTPNQVKRLQGSTKEELLADADEFLKDFAPAKTDEEDPEGDEAENGRVIPQGLIVTNGGDPKSHANTEPDYEKLAAEIGPQRVL